MHTLEQLTHDPETCVLQEKNYDMVPRSLEKHRFPEASEPGVAKAIVGAKRDRRVQDLRTLLESPQTKTLAYGPAVSTCIPVTVDDMCDLRGSQRLL